MTSASVASMPAIASIDPISTDSTKRDEDTLRWMDQLRSDPRYLRQ